MQLITVALRIEPQYPNAAGIRDAKALLLKQRCFLDLDYAGGGARHIDSLAWMRPRFG
jgi:hypothetical protein